jgi:hypothetical protein
VRINGHGERRSHLRRVQVRLRVQRELVAAFGGQRQAHDAARVRDHEVDGRGGDLLGRDDEVALVFAVFVIDQHDHLPALRSSSTSGIEENAISRRL